MMIKIKFPQKPVLILRLEGQEICAVTEISHLDSLNMDSEQPKTIQNIFYFKPHLVSNLQQPHLSDFSSIPKKSRAD